MSLLPSQLEGAAMVGWLDGEYLLGVCFVSLPVFPATALLFFIASALPLRLHVCVRLFVSREICVLCINVCSC